MPVAFMFFPSCAKSFNIHIIRRKLCPIPPTFDARVKKQSEQLAVKSGLVNSKWERYNKMNHTKIMNIGVFSMKKIWKICAIVLLASVLTIFAGCSARKAITAEEFQKQAKSAGYTVTEPKDDSSGATKSYVATKDGSDVEIDYHLFSSAYSAQNWYSTQKNSMKTGTTKTVVDSDNYNKYTVTNGEINYVLVRVDKTAVLCKAVASKAGEVDSFLNTIKY
jgi:uncharacterized protein YcfL